MGVKLFAELVVLALLAERRPQRSALRIVNPESLALHRLNNSFVEPAGQLANHRRIRRRQVEVELLALLLFLFVRVLGVLVAKYVLQEVHQRRLFLMTSGACFALRFCRLHATGD